MAYVMTKDEIVAGLHLAVTACLVRCGVEKADLVAREVVVETVTALETGGWRLSPSTLPAGEAHEALIAQGWEFIPAGYRKIGLAFERMKGPVAAIADIEAATIALAADPVTYAEGEFAAAVTAIEEKAHEPA